jgi:hypothetical protein
MLRPALLCCLSLSTVAVLAQPAGPRPYQPAVPAPSTYNNYGGYGGYGGTTAAGSSMQGMASVISAKGDYNLSTSAAAINYTQAQKNYIENRQLATNTYFEMRATNKAYTKAERGPPPTKEQMARLAAEGKPKPLASYELDAVSGQIAWPIALTGDQYAASRAELEQLSTKRSHYGGLSAADQNRAGQTIDSMSQILGSSIKDTPPQQYLAAKNFLKSLMFNMTQGQL